MNKLAPQAQQRLLTGYGADPSRLGADDLTLGTGSAPDSTVKNELGDLEKHNKVRIRSKHWPIAPTNKRTMATVNTTVLHKKIQRTVFGHK